LGCLHTSSNAGSAALSHRDADPLTGYCKAEP